MEVRDYYKEHYCLEVARRNDLTSALSLPLGILTLLIGGLAAIAQGIHVPLDNIAILQLALMAVAVFFIFLTAYFLLRSYYNYTYGYAPTPLEIKAFKEDLTNYYIAIGESSSIASQKADSEVLEHIDAEYAAHADRNSKNNNRKSSFKHKANGALIAAIITTLAVGVTFLTKSIRTASMPQKAEVVFFQETVMTVPTNSPTPVTPAAPHTTPVAPVKPTPPPGQLLKEHVDPKPKR